MALEFEGFAVSEAGDAASGLAAALADPPALAIAAVGLPGRTGYDLCRDLRSSDETADIPVLLTFSPMDVFDPVRAERAGAAGVLAKPFLPSHLLERIAAVLGPRFEASLAEARASVETPAAVPGAETSSGVAAAAAPEIGGASELPSGFVQPLDESIPPGDDALRARIEEAVDQRLGAMLAPGGALRAAIDMALERLVRDRVEARFAEVLDRVVRERAGEGGPSGT